MRCYLKIKSSKLIRSLLCIVLTGVVLTSLMGFRDIKKEGVKCKFTARIVDIEKPPPDKKVLVVKQTPVTQSSKNIYVLVTDDTSLGFNKKRGMTFDDLNIEMCIEIEGFKIVEKKDGKDILVVQAKKIMPVLE